MNVELSYDKEFSDLLNNLKDKYGAAIFELEGIGSQLDLNKFSKEFFGTKVTADASIDANANVGDSTVVSYSVELTKPYEKLNSLYLLWKEMRRLYHTDIANKIIEMHISGDIYIHDLHSVNKPYSYARDTPINIKFYDEEMSTIMEQLYISMMLHHDKVITCDREYYNVTSDEIFVEDFDEISNKQIWTKVKYVIKHKRHNKLLKFTLCGNPFELMVTEDHPMILKDGSIKDAKDVTTKDLLKSWCLSHENIAKIEVVEDSVFNDYVYDITTESGTFIVDSLVVHNCFNYSTYDIMNKGLPMITKIKSVEPKHLYSFKSQLEQFVVIASNSTLGACMHHSQRILIRHGGLVKSITSKEFVEQYDMEAKFIQNGHIWYTGNVYDSVEVYEHDRFVPIKRVFKSPYVDDVYTIKTKTGKICKVNKHHIFKVLRNEEYVEVEAKDLQLYDTVVNTLHGNIPIDKSHEDYRHGQFVGILCGDGCLTRSDWFGIAVGHSKEYLMDWMDEYVNDYYPNIKSTRYYNEEKHYWNYFMYNVKSQREIINKYFDKDNLYCHNKYPTHMNDKSLEFKLGFIDGLLATDGSASDGSISVQLTNETIIDIVESILYECGITQITRRTNISNSLNKRPMYALGFRKAWKDNFNLFNKYKASVYINSDGTEIAYFGKHAHTKSGILDYTSIGNCSKSWKHKYTGDTYHDVIISIDKESNDDSYVYEIETDSHWYSCGGILTHNTGIADVLIVMSHYVKNILASLEDAHFTFKNEDAVWTYVKETITSLIYTLNQPFRGGIQSAFTNVSVFDKSFIEDMSAMYIFPDGSSPDAEIVKRLQDIYVDVMNETLERTAATFPVTTAACAIDDKRMFKNPDDVKHFIRQNLQFGFMNFYSGKSTTLSSCCFNGKQMAQYYKNGECTVSRFDEIVDNDDIKLYIDNEYPRATAKLVKVKMPYATHFMYNIVTASNAILDVTGDHIHYTNNGDKYTYELDIGSLLYDSKIQMFTPITSISKYISDDKYVYCFKITEPNAPPYFILYNGIITHNCRLRSDMETIGYTNSIGGSGTKIGSVSVGTVNMYRLAVRANGDVNKFIELLKHTVGAVARVNHARRTIIRKKSEKGFAPLYTHEFISLDKQFSTCGINGFYEAMCELSIDITSGAGINRAIDIIEIVNSENKKYDKTFGYSHNCEQVPAESASVKIAQKDRLLGYNKEYELYSNQFIPLTASADILERIKIQGALDSHFSGGSILHLNFDQRIDDVDKIYNILQDAVLQGVVYMAINYVLNECENGHMSVGNVDICPVCGGELCNKFSRVVGFLSNVKNWNKTRRSVDFPNRKFYEVKS